MENSKLQDFVTITVLHNRITFGDVRRLQRDYLAHGVSDREQVEILLHLDGMIERVDRAWADWLAAAIFDFAVFSERSVDAVESGTCDWLLDHLAVPLVVLGQAGQDPPDLVPRPSVQLAVDRTAAVGQAGDLAPPVVR